MVSANNIFNVIHYEVTLFSGKALTVFCQKMKSTAYVLLLHMCSEREWGDDKENKKDLDTSRVHAAE